MKQILSVFILGISTLGFAKSDMTCGDFEFDFSIRGKTLEQVSQTSSLTYVLANNSIELKSEYRTVVVDGKTREYVVYEAVPVSKTKELEVQNHKTPGHPAFLPKVIRTELNAVVQLDPIDDFVRAQWLTINFEDNEFTNRGITWSYVPKGKKKPVNEECVVHNTKQIFDIESTPEEDGNGPFFTE